MVKTASYPVDSGGWVIKSFVTYLKGRDGGANGYNNPNGFQVTTLVYQHRMH